MNFNKLKNQMNGIRLFRNTLFMIGVILVFVIIFYIHAINSRTTLPLPISKSAATALGFNIYYPKQSLLPKDYIFNKNSFVTNNVTLICAVTYPTNKIIISEQRRPTNLQIQDFYTQQMPLRTTFNTVIGVAALGAINSRSVVSVPTNSNTWIIITAPGNISQPNLELVSQSLRLAQ